MIITVIGVTILGTYSIMIPLIISCACILCISFSVYAIQNCWTHASDEDDNDDDGDNGEEEEEEENT